MKTLYIIGNGFDIAHHLPTGYRDFRKWLAKQNDDDSRSVAWIIDKIGVYTVGDLWSSLEEGLGRIKFEDYLNEIKDEYCDSNNSDIEDCLNANDPIYAHLITMDRDQALAVISDLYTQWIRSVKIDAESELIYEDFIKPDGLYLSFNYTDTLEKLYRINQDNILHIHGFANDKYSNLIFGHGNEYDEDKFERIADKVMGFDAEGVGRKYCRALKNLYKDTKSIYESEREWFDDLTKLGISDIVALGFSFGEVDDRYLYEIKNRLPNVNWHFSIYTSDEKARQRDLNNVSKFINRIGLAKKQCHVFDAEDPRINVNI